VDFAAAWSVVTTSPKTECSVHPEFREVTKTTSSFYQSERGCTIPISVIPSESYESRDPQKLETGRIASTLL
jgi:hypothetical protein